MWELDRDRDKETFEMRQKGNGKKKREERLSKRRRAFSLDRKFSEIVSLHHRNSGKAQKPNHHGLGIRKKRGSSRGRKGALFYVSGRQSEEEYFRWLLFDSDQRHVDKESQHSSEKDIETRKQEGGVSPMFSPHVEEHHRLEHDECH